MKDTGHMYQAAVSIRMTITSKFEVSLHFWQSWPTVCPLLVTPSLHAHNSKIPRTYVHTSFIFATLKEGGIPICPGEERKCAYFATEEMRESYILAQLSSFSSYQDP